MVLGIPAGKDWELRQLDIDIAYLEANAKEKLYIVLPEDCRNSCNQVGCLQNAMYGLVHAGLLWPKTFIAELAARGFEQCQADPCVFRRVLCGKVVVIIVVYIDNLLVASETKRDEEQAINDIRSCFPIKDLGDAGFYLGYHITRDRDAGTLKFDKHHYVRTMASKFGVEKTSTMPAAAGAKPLSKDDALQTETETEEMRVTPYREAVGGLMWAATMTRLDVAYAAHQLENVNDNPEPAHWRAAKRALQYLWRKQDVGITYGGTPGSYTKLSEWVDTDFATCPDSRHLASGGIVTLRGVSRSVGSRDCRRWPRHLNQSLWRWQKL
ncbi:unnamed protein product [Ascophyllum nodosum]